MFIKLLALFDHIRESSMIFSKNCKYIMHTYVPLRPAYMIKVNILVYHRKKLTFYLSSSKCYLIWYRIECVVIVWIFNMNYVCGRIINPKHNKGLCDDICVWMELLYIKVDVLWIFNNVCCRRHYVLTICSMFMLPWYSNHIMYIGLIYARTIHISVHYTPISVCSSVTQ